MRVGQTAVLKPEAVGRCAVLQRDRWSTNADIFVLHNATSHDRFVALRGNRPTSPPWRLAASSVGRASFSIQSSPPGCRQHSCPAMFCGILNIRVVR